jgi:chloride channel 3/4/5
MTLPHSESADQLRPLLDPTHLHVGYSGAGQQQHQHSAYDAASIISSHVSKDELALADTAVGERLPYNAYTTIDWLHDLVKDAFRYRTIRSQRGVRGFAWSAWEDYQGWIAAVMIGVLTAFVAFFVDLTESVLGDLKFGVCTRNPLFGRELCCGPDEETCTSWRPWTNDISYHSFAVYAFVAWLLAMSAGLVTKLTREEIPAFAAHDGNHHDGHEHHSHGGQSQPAEKPPNKIIYMAAGSGIPEIKLVLSGFEFPHLLGWKVLCVKAVGAAMAVASGLCLGKEGPFVHISSSAGYVVGVLFPKFRDNGRRLREMISVACSSALAVAFGSPVGGVLFVYEEMSSQFPRKVLWRAFLCSLVSAMVLKSLDPNRTGRLVLLETKYGVKYESAHYIFFILLGVSGGLFGAAFCKGSQLWAKYTRDFINRRPLVELSLLVLVTAALQYPNPITREPALLMIKSLLSDCLHGKDDHWICEHESRQDKSQYISWLVYGSIVKIIMTILTTGSRGSCLLNCGYVLLLTHIF